MWQRHSISLLISKDWLKTIIEFWFPNNREEEHVVFLPFFFGLNFLISEKFKAKESSNWKIQENIFQLYFCKHIPEWEGNYSNGGLYSKYRKEYDVSGWTFNFVDSKVKNKFLGSTKFSLYNRSIEFQQKLIDFQFHLSGNEKQTETFLQYHYF